MTIGAPWPFGINRQEIQQLVRGAEQWAHETAVGRCITAQIRRRAIE